MTTYSKYSILLAGLLFLFASIRAQGTQENIIVQPEFRRLINHEAIDKEQKSLLAADGKADDKFAMSPNEEINFLLTDALTRKTDELQYKIESDSLFDHRLKVNYLVGLYNLLKYYRQNIQSKKVDALHLPEILSSYEAAMEADRNGKSIEPIVKALPYDAGKTLIEAGIFDRNPGYKNSSDILVLKYCVLHPDEIFPTLRTNPDVPFADSLVKAVAKKEPGQLYNYAQANNRFGAIIRSIQDDEFVKTIVRMSQSLDGQQYFPFLDNIVRGKMTFEEIDTANRDSLLYYRLLVKTQMDYVQRALSKDTAFAFKELTAKLEKKAQDVFITTINGLHEEPDDVRFKCIQDLSPQELYYLAVLSDGLIYTSSYTKGVYQLMMKKIGNRGDSLLLSLNFDKYRKFISQAAAYNTLGGFLNSFPNHDDATNLMKAFVGRLEESEGLEDGVDVADSYASIIETNKKLAAEVLNYVQENYKRNVSQDNKRGIVIYNILNKLFFSADSARKIDLTKELGILPVYNIPLSTLTNDKNEVVVQVFFYGDEDGKTDFNIFLDMFNNANWKIDKTNKQWILVKSAKGKPVSIYANIPFDEDTGEDDNAQQALGNYFEEESIIPTITINRGHSYHALTTIAYMSPASRIVFMGSCGGFNLIDAILKKSPDAHIIASKQIGKRDINKPFLQLLTDKLRNGSDIDWIPFWQEFRSKSAIEGFEDYIPPYRNLGAIFIKAYKIAMKE